MPKLTKEQARELAQVFYDVSHELGNFRLGNSPSLTRSQMDRLESLEWSVRNSSSDLVALSIQLELDDLQGTLNNIGQATKRMQRATKRLKKINNILKIATAAVTLGAAIISGNPGAILSSLESALSVTTEAEEDEEDA